MRRERIEDATSGLLAIAVALGVTELVAAISGSVAPIIALGNEIIAHTPERVTHAVISTLGTRDKPFLITTIVVLSLAFGAALGIAARRRPIVGPVGFIVLWAVGTWAVLVSPVDSVAIAAISPLVGAFAGWQALKLLLRSASVEEPSTAPEAPEAQRIDRKAPSRRAFLGFAATAAGASVTSLVAGRVIAASAVDVDAQRRTLASQLPVPANGASAPPPPGLGVPGLSELVTPNDKFYRIDTALSVPRVDAERWRLRVTGMVDHPLELTLPQLLAMPTQQGYVTLVCVSNEVGGKLAGNALWLGVPLSDILAQAGVQPGATQIVGRSVDGFTVGFPTQVALDGRASMVAFGMNGDPLPAQHGFPARLIVPGLYGYVSATKWLEEIELTTLEAFDAYWVPRGWDKQAPIKTQSRIDVPRDGQSVTAGHLAIAGVAWGGDRGVNAVEVRVRPRNTGADGGEWRPAKLGDALSGSTWRQWVAEWDAQAGDYVIDVRATDGKGQVQTGIEAPPAPNGATGYHRIDVRVRT